MQVSWIDPEEVRALLAQIEGPRKAASAPAWEVHTLPVQPLPPATAEPLMGEREPAPAPPPPAPAPMPDLPLNDTRPGPPAGEIWNIREQLRTLRERVVESGLVPAAAVPETTESVEPESRFEAPPAVTAPLSLSPEAHEAMNELLGPITVGPAPEAPPHSDPSSLPQPTPPRPSTAPLKIEYAGPAPSGQEVELLFGPGTTPSTPVAKTAPAEPELTPAETVASPYAMAPEATSWFAATMQPPPLPPVAAPAPSIVEPPPIPVQEQVAEPPPLPQVARQVPDFIVPALGLSDRLGALAHWSIQRLGTDEVLLVDDYGDVLWGGQQHTALVLAAMMAWHSSQRSAAENVCSQPERIDKEISAGRLLTVIPVHTRYGNVSLAAICTSRVPDDAVSDVRSALQRAVEGS